MVSDARHGSQSDDDDKLVCRAYGLMQGNTGQEPLLFGRKRTLKPLPQQQVADRVKTPTLGYPVDRLIATMDVSYVGEWLTRAGAALTDFQWWWAQEDNSVLFAHFWLSEFDDDQRNDLLTMESDILRDEIAIAFTVAQRDNVVTDEDVSKLVKAVFPEYPTAFTGDAGTFIDILRMLSADKLDDFKHIMSRMRCTSSNPQYTQWLLALRSFTLVSFSTAIVNFFRNMLENERAAGDDVPEYASEAKYVDRPLTAVSQPRPGTAVTASSSRSQSQEQSAYRPPGDRIPADFGSVGSSEPAVGSSLSSRPTTAVLSRVADIYTQLAFRCVKLNFPDVLFYLISRGLTHMDAVDGLGRSYLAVAVLHRKYDVAEFLLENKRLFDVNQPSLSGNTALHAAVNIGDISMVRMLLSAGADPYAKNTEANDATPIDLATMLERDDIISILTGSAPSQHQPDVLAMYAVIVSEQYADIVPR